MKKICCYRNVTNKSLLGSDYTEGVNKVGTVTALEILSAFSENDGMLQFKKMMENPEFDKIEKNKLSPEISEKIRVVRNLKGKTDLPKDFPSPVVIDAYMNPVVDKSKEKFEFSRPDLQVTLSVMKISIEILKGSS